MAGLSLVPDPEDTHVIRVRNLPPVRPMPLVQVMPAREVLQVVPEPAVEPRPKGRHRTPEDVPRATRADTRKLREEGRDWWTIALVTLTLLGALAGWVLLIARWPAL